MAKFEWNKFIDRFGWISWKLQCTNKLGAFTTLAEVEKRDRTDAEVETRKREIEKQWGVLRGENHPPEVQKYIDNGCDLRAARELAVYYAMDFSDDLGEVKVGCKSVFCKLIVDALFGEENT